MTVGPCPPDTQPQHGVVVLSLTDWRALYPEFAGLSDVQITAAFNGATLHMSNSCRSIVCDAAKREVLLYLLTAHVAFLRFGKNDGAGNVTPAPGVVGRISGAHEGSVSVQVQLDGNNQTRAWYAQTQYGLEFWDATARYRTFRYVPPVVRCACGTVPCICGTLGPTGSGWGYNGGTA
jgi:hypothetical protein